MFLNGCAPIEVYVERWVFGGSVYFYIDESGHTGPNLFDINQPVLYYGVVSSKYNLELLLEDRFASLRKICKVDRLHATELGNSGLVKIINQLIKIQKDYEIKFDLYTVSKPDHAIISFFDQVFDAGMNPAMTWSGYWTPLKFPLLLRVASLFDTEIAKDSWNARIEANDEQSIQLLVSVCQRLREKTPQLQDKRAAQIITDALFWAEKNPSEIYYNAKSKSDRLSIMPNVIGFQSVLHGISNRLKRSNKKAKEIVVDQQSQFNKSQKALLDFYAKARNVKLEEAPGMPVMDLSKTPEIPLRFSSSSECAGLEMVDILIWIFKRHLEGKVVAKEITPMLMKHASNMYFDEISLPAIHSKWSKYFNEQPEPSEEAMKNGRAFHEIEEKRRIDFIRSNT